MNRYNSTDLFGSKQKFYGTTKYPIIPLNNRDIYVYTQEEDRFDQLAFQYYGNPKYWWIISIANAGLEQNSYFLPVGIQIRIPQDINGIIQQFKQLNER